MLSVVHMYIHVHVLCASVRRVSVVSVCIARLASHVLNKKHVILTFQIEFCICVHSSVLSHVGVIDSTQLAEFGCVSCDVTLDVFHNYMLIQSVCACMYMYMYNVDM